MSRSITVGIDIGTHQIKVAVCEAGNQPDAPKLLGAGYSESKGLRHGYIVNAHEAAESIIKAVKEAEKKSGIEIKKAFLAVGGIGLQSVISTGSLIISRADLEITDLDVEKVIQSSRSEIPSHASLNRKILHEIPLAFKIDSKPVLGLRPQGFKAVKLEVRTLFITCLEHHINDMVQAVEDAGIQVIDVIAAPLAAGVVTLTKAQKIAGCVLANIGSETVSITVYENNIPISLEVFPIGSNDITNDIALGLKITLEEAERVKRGDTTSTPSYPRKKLEEIIVARLSDMLELIEAHLRKINKNGLLPAGIIITGGGSGVTTIKDLAKAYLKLPSRISSPSEQQSSDAREGRSDTVQIKDAMWSVAYGLCAIGFASTDGGVLNTRPGFFTSLRRLFRSIGNWFSQFLP